MKKSKVLATTTLAGALLFTGVNTNNANAEAKQDLQLASEKEWQIQHDRLLKARLSGQGGEGGGPGAVTSYQDSYQEYIDYYKKWGSQNGYDISIRSEKESAELFKDDKSVDFDNYQLPKDQTNSTTTTQNNNEQNQTANNNPQTQDNNNLTTQNNEQQTQGNSNNVAIQTNEAQTTTQVLPETGEQSNSGLVTIIASVLLAVGSLLAFRRTSNSK